MLGRRASLASPPATFVRPSGEDNNLSTEGTREFTDETLPSGATGVTGSGVMAAMDSVAMAVVVNVATAPSVAVMVATPAVAPPVRTPAASTATTPAADEAQVGLAATTLSASAGS